MKSGIQGRLWKLSIQIAALLILAANAGGQNLEAVSKHRPFEPAEELTYKAEFTRALLRKIDVASFKFTVSQTSAPAEKLDEGQKSSAYALKLTGEVESDGFFTKLFGIDFHQRVESTVEPESFVVHKTIRLDEQGKRVRTSEAVFNHETGEVTWIERDPNNPARPPRTETGKFAEPIQDVLSAIYYIRTKELQPGSKIEVPISDSGRFYRVSVEVGERKRMKTPLGRGSVLRIDADLFGPQGMIAGSGKLSIWLTDDKRRIPVKAHLKTEYGSFDITLKKTSYH